LQANRLIPFSNQENHINKLHALLDYQHRHVKKIVRHIKYGNDKNAGISAGRYLAPYIKQWYIEPVILVPIPISKERKATRGYNQAVALAEGIAQVCNYPIADILAHKPHLSNQFLAGKGRLKRYGFMKSTIEVVDSNIQSNPHYLLIDDVLTTGSTLQAAATALHLAGAKHIHGATLAGLEYL
jgi:predicted amidophosphoribosyltransferase